MQPYHFRQSTLGLYQGIVQFLCAGEAQRVHTPYSKFERNELGEPVHFPHFGDVIVGNNVFIGSNTTVERATLGSTVIEDNVKIDDLVQVGHNSHIGEGSMITVGAIVCGGAELKPQSYLAPNVTVKEKVTMGYRGFAGIGAVVLKDVADNTVVAGVPAKEIIRNK